MCVKAFLVAEIVARHLLNDLCLVSCILPMCRNSVLIEGGFSGKTRPRMNSVSFCLRQDLKGENALAHETFHCTRHSHGDDRDIRQS